MSDSENTPTVTPAEPEAEPAQETDWKAEARKWEDRAKANKTAAEKLAELEEANKTAEEKAQERLAAAERRAADLEAKATVAEVAATTSVPVDILAGPTDRTPEGLAAFAEKLLAFRGEQIPGPKAPYVPAATPGQGNKPAKSVSAGAEMFAESRKK
jgi:hypothetical protein